MLLLRIQLLYEWMDGSVCVWVGLWVSGSVGCWLNGWDVSLSSKVAEGGTFEHFELLLKI